MSIMHCHDRQYKLEHKLIQIPIIIGIDESNVDLLIDLMPEVKGSEKQLEWVKTIQRSEILYYADHVNHLYDEAQTQEDWDALAAYLIHIDFYILERCQSASLIISSREKHEVQYFQHYEFRTCQYRHCRLVFFVNLDRYQDRMKKFCCPDCSKYSHETPRWVD